MAALAIPPVDSPFATLDPRSALAAINMAILKAETNQRYAIEDREIIRDDLRWMYPERARLEKQVAALNARGIRFRRVVPC